MKKITLLAAALTLSIFSASAQFEQASPSEVNQNPNEIIPTRALFDELFAIDVGANGAIGAQSQAGVIFFNDVYWISTWNADTIHVLDSSGNFMETFTIPGLSGTRSLSSDGTNIYIGAAGLEIFVIDPVARTVINTIDVNTGSDATARMVTYDEALDGGNGGFWIGNFGSAIAALDMSGNELSVIAAGDHGTTIYGGAVDNFSDDGPHLWIHDQTAAGGADIITQIDPSAGTPTGVSFDYASTGGAGSTAFLAGGLSISDEVEANTVAFVGLCQCDPSNIVFGLELKVETAGVDDNQLADLSVYPNPATSDIVRLQTQAIGDMQVAVYDVLGKLVINTVVSNGELNVGSLKAGVYMIQVTQDNASATKKLVIK